MKVVIIGSNGAIGSALKKCISNRLYGIKLINVVRSKQNSDDVLFDEFIKLDLSEVKYLIDASNGSIECYQKLIRKLELYPSVRCLHISTVRLNDVDTNDPYAIYKKKVLDIWLESDLKNFEFIYGDLFEYEERLLGYWSFVSRVSNKLVISSREVNVFCVKELVEAYFTRANLDVGKPLRRIVKVPKIVCNMLFLLRFNTFFSKLVVVVL